MKHVNAPSVATIKIVAMFARSETIGRAKRSLATRTPIPKIANNNGPHGEMWIMNKGIRGY